MSSNPSAFSSSYIGQMAPPYSMSPQSARLDTDALVQAAQRDATIHLAHNPSAEEEQKVLAATLLCSLNYGTTVTAPQLTQALQILDGQHGGVDVISSWMPHSSLSFDSVSDDDTISEDGSTSDNNPRKIANSEEVQQTVQARQGTLYTLAEVALRSPANAGSSAPQQTLQAHQSMLYTLSAVAPGSPANTGSSAPQQASQKPSKGKGKEKANKRVRFSDEDKNSSTHQGLQTAAKPATQRAAASALKGGRKNLRSKPMPSFKARIIAGQEEANHAQASGTGTSKTMQVITTREHSDTIASLAQTILPPTRTPFSAPAVPAEGQATQRPAKRRATGGRSALPTTPQKTAANSRTTTPQTVASEIPTPPATRTTSRRNTTNVATNVEPAPILPPGTSLPAPRAPALTSSPTPAAATSTADSPLDTLEQSPTAAASAKGKKIFLRCRSSRFLLHNSK